MRVRGAWALVVSAACVLAALFAVAALSPKRTAGPCTMIGDALMLRDVPEASGLALSRRHDEVIWTHNDSGNETVLFAVNVSGQARGRVRVPARTRDWEDLSAGPCPPFDKAQGGSGDCLYIADIGDNDLARRGVQMLRVPEPEPGADRTERPDVFTLVYPDGPHNAEALFMVEGTVFIVTKDRDGKLYRSAAPLERGGEVRLRRVGNLGLTGVTDAETSRDGRSVVVRTSREAVVYRAADFVGDNIRPTLRIPIGNLREPQGEGVALDGDVLYLASERGAWNPAGRLLSLRCSLPSQPLPSQPLPS
jgi:hypothetical protein